MSDRRGEGQVKESAAFLPAPDALWRRAPTPHAARYHLLGVPLEFAANAPALLEMADEVFGERAAPDTPDAAKRKQLRVFLHDAPETWLPESRPPFLTRMQGPYFLVAAGSSLGFADHAAGFAAAFLTPGLVADRLTAQVCFVECLGMYLVSRERPVALHAAGVVHQGRCVLLTGPDGAGKSTLAYACLRAGCGLLAEDIVFAAEPDAVREVFGNARHLHLLPDAVRLFPELAAAPRVRQLNGETKLRISVHAVRAGAAVGRAPIGGVCSVSRASNGATCLRPADPAHIRHALTDFKGDPPLDREAIARAADQLLTGRMASLEVGKDLGEAVETLRNWIETT
jgi:hypothetical protein